MADRDVQGVLRGPVGRALVKGVHAETVATLALAQVKGAHAATVLVVVVLVVWKGVRVVKAINPAGKPPVAKRNQKPARQMRKMPMSPSTGNQLPFWNTTLMALALGVCPEQRAWKVEL